ncbi:hypothetical protein OIO90_002577 [Microbotryomycetes sp. JL221]|nr:hypothetical protein OIO90_002577 [Microbotryomycetes sp. JL221]
MPASTQKQDQDAQTPRLPIELIHCIIDVIASQIPQTFFKLDQQSIKYLETLKSLTLTSKIISQYARLKLWSNVTINNVDDLDRFLSCTSFDSRLNMAESTEPSDTEVASMTNETMTAPQLFVKTLRIGHISTSFHMVSLIRDGELSLPAQRNKLRQVLKRCTRLKELRLAGLKQASTCWLVPPQNFDSTLSSSSSTSSSLPCLPQLRHLYITDNFFVVPRQLVTQLLSSSVLPALTSLTFALNQVDLVETTHDQDEQEWRLSTTTAPVLSQLICLSTSESLDIGHSHINDDDNNVESLSSSRIQFLDCWQSELARDVQILNNLPKQLKILRLNESRGMPSVVVKPDLDGFTANWLLLQREKETMSSSLIELKQIWIPKSWQSDQKFQTLRQVCKSLNIEIMYENRQVDEIDSRDLEFAAFDEMFWKIASQVERQSFQL